MKLNKHIKGMSLLEILIVLAIFSILGILITRAVVLTLQGSKKSAAIVRVRENLEYSLSIMERQIRNANSITACPNPDPKRIDFIDQKGNEGSFSCVNTGEVDSYIASGSAVLTSNTVSVVSCSFSCTAGGTVNPSVVGIDITMKDASNSAVGTSNVSESTQIYLRNY